MVKFTCNVGGRLLRGIVKEKNAARTTFLEAVAKGESAGLFEQSMEASDVFSTKLGNVPAGDTVIVEIEYVGELKQDAEMNGIRFTIPTSIAPRYGSISSMANSSNASLVLPGSTKIVVDAQMPSGSFMQGIQSPSHPIAVTMGTTSTEPHTEPSMTKASATLALGETGLDKDFVLIVLSKDSGIPKAILETHPTIPNQRALMLTLVPRFSLPPSRPEIVFVADRSSSMHGSSIVMLISAMKVLLKSMPLGVKFNVCSFGSSYSFLFAQSMSYTQDTLAAAISHLEGFDANMGGTETFSAMKATIERRFKDIPLEIILLTDGDIWQQADLFKYLNEEVEKSKGDIRVFPLGIGDGASHALIEGIARAGNGFSQSVQNGEKFDNRLVRMLKGALSPHVTDYSLEVKYEVDKGDDDFEMVEVFDKVMEGLKSSLTEVEQEKPKPKAPISLFDTDDESINIETPIAKGDRYADLPALPPPKLIQAPYKIPPLFPFSRTTVYLLMSPNTVQKNPISVVLRGTSAHGALEIEIPVEVLSTPAETINQLAAKKAMQDLEEGRGWIFDTKDDKGTLFSEKLPSKFSDMVERETVRLGVQFGVAGKWCSFVAVAANDVAGNDGKEQADSETARIGKFRPELHIIDHSQSFKRKASAATSDRRSKYHALIGTPLGQVDRRFMTRPSGAGQERPLGYLSEILDRSKPRELAAVSGNRSEGAQADRCVSAETNNRESKTEDIPRYRQHMSQGSQIAPNWSRQQPLSSSGPLIQNSFSGTRAAKQSYVPNSSQPQPPSGPSIKRFSGMVNPFSAPVRQYSSYSAASSGFVAAPESGAISWLSEEGSPPNSFGSTRSAAPAAAPLIDFSTLTRGVQQSSETRGGAIASDSETSNGAQVSTMFKSAEDSDPDDEDEDEDDNLGFGLLHDDDDNDSPTPQPPPPAPRIDWAKASAADKVLRIIALQGFEGCWDWHADLLPIMGLSRAPEQAGRTDDEERKVWATVLVVAWLQGKMRTEEEVWELVVEKAMAWLAEAADGEDVLAMDGEAQKMIRA